MAGPKLANGAALVNNFTSTNGLTSTNGASGETAPQTAKERIAAVRRRLGRDRDPVTQQQDADIEAKRLEDFKKQQDRQETEQAALRADDVAAMETAKQKAEAARAAEEKANAARVEAERLSREKMEAARVEDERLSKEKAQAAAKEVERIAKEKAEAAHKEAERIAKEKAAAAHMEAERVAKEKAEAERIAKEKAAAVARVQAEIRQKVITTTVTECKTLEQNIDTLKVTYAKQHKRGLEEVEEIQACVSDIEGDQKEVSKLLEEANAELGQIQLKIDNLNKKASQNEIDLEEMKKLAEDKSHELADLEKAGEAQLVALEAKMTEVFKKLDQLMKEVTLAVTPRENISVAVKVGDEAAPQVTGQTNGQVNGQANGQVIGQVNGHLKAQPNGKIVGQANSKTNGQILDKPMNELSHANPTSEERADVETEGKLTFEAWPTVAANREDLVIRRVKLSNLPPNATLKNVAALVWGGIIQEFVYSNGMPVAEILFLDPTGCKQYFDATANGVIYPGQPDRRIKVEACDPESARENVKEYVEKGMTRCIRVLDVEPDWTKIALIKVAAGKAGKRTVDGVICGKSQSGRHIVEFRFGKIADAIIFKAEIHKDAEWETCVATFGDDPCAKHTGVHTGKM